MAGLPEEELAWPRDMTGSGGLLLPVAPLRQMLCAVARGRSFLARGFPGVPKPAPGAAQTASKSLWMPLTVTRNWNFSPTPAPVAAFGDNKHNISSWGDRHQNHGAAR